MSRVEQIGDATLYLGDCRELLPKLHADTIVTDPPWGSSTKCNAQRFIRTNSPWWDNVDTSKVVTHRDIAGDTEPFDPAPFLRAETILWGANWFASDLPVSGGWLIWDKRKGAEDMAAKGWPLGEAELAWTNVLGAPHVFRNLWAGLLRSTEKGEHYHPTQKPIDLMTWCLQFTKGPVVLDPFMGSGATGIAALSLGRRFIGIEIEPTYFDIACRRIEAEARQPRLFAEPAQKPRQEALHV